MDEPEESKDLVARLGELQALLERLIPNLTDATVSRETWEEWDNAHDEFDDVWQQLQALMRRYFPE